MNGMAVLHQNSRAISRVSGNLLGIGDGFPNTSLVLMEHCLRFHQGWSCNFAVGFHFPPNDHFLPNRNKIATQSLVKIWTSYWSISQLHHWGICPSSKLWLWLLMFKDIIYYLLKTTYIPGWKFISVIGRTLPYALGWHQIQSLRHQVDD